MHFRRGELHRKDRKRAAQHLSPDSQARNQRVEQRWGKGLLGTSGDQREQVGTGAKVVSVGN